MYFLSKCFPFLLVGLFLNSCQGDLACLQVLDKHAATLSLAIMEDGDCIKNPKFTSIEIYQVDDYTHRWSLGAREPQKISVLNFRKIPAGFEQSLPPPLLQKGDRIGILLRGPGITAGINITLE